MNAKSVVLSVLVPTYGHEKYISQALDSILMQKTKYTYEVLVGEDASPDNTRQILKKYEDDYPGMFTMLYRQSNMRKTPISNQMDLWERAKGKYVIMLEGDDYWTSEDKIEKQINFLEDHPECIAVSHNCIVVDESSKPNGEHYPECKDSFYTFKHMIKDILPGQLATVMHRNFYSDPSFDKSILYKRLAPGDRLLYFVLLSYGHVYCIKEVMSAYRHVVYGGTSCSANYQYNYDYDKKWHHELLIYAYKTDNRQAIICAETLYSHLMLAGLKHKRIKLDAIIDSFRSFRCKKSIPLSLIQRYFFMKLHKNSFLTASKQDSKM